MLVAKSAVKGPETLPPSEPEIIPSPHDEGVGRVRERGNPIINSSVLRAALPVPLPARPSRGEGEQPFSGGSVKLPAGSQSTELLLHDLILAAICLRLL